MNDRPCVRCGDHEDDGVHSFDYMLWMLKRDLENAVLYAETERAFHLHRMLGNYIDAARKKGWDGHKFDPYDNLKFLEKKAEEAGLI